MSRSHIERPMGSGEVASYLLHCRADVDESGDLVSVITRTRNRHDLLREAVESVAAQDYPHVELVVINDGGAPVEEVLAPYMGRLDVQLLNLDSVGRCRAGNAGLEAARGTWITWLDDDDLYHPDHLSTLLHGIRTSGKQIAYTDAWQIKERRLEDGSYEEVERSVPWSEDFSRVMMFRQSFIHLVTVMHHRDCAIRLGGMDPTLEVLEDWDMFFRFSEDYEFHHIKKTTAAFRVRDDMTNAVTAMRKEFVETRRRLFGRYAHLAMPELLNQLQLGVSEIAALHARISALESRVQDLESRS